jgi:DNA-binding response OmpR family regulator/signal transduction histidine kinase
LSGQPDSAEALFELALQTRRPTTREAQETARQKGLLYRIQQQPAAAAGFLGIILLLGLLLFRLWRSREKEHVAAYLADHQKSSLANQLAQAEQRAEQKNQFFAQIAADIRTPLTLAKIPAELLGTDHTRELSAAAQSLLRSVNRNLDRLQEFAQDIAQLAEPGMLQAEGLYMQPVLLPSFAADIRDSFELLAQARHIQFAYTLQLAPNAETILIDRNKLEKITLTLILNAFRATPPGGKITLDLSTQYLPDSSVHVECAVRDTGPHIPESDLRDILKWHKRGRPTDEGQTALLSVIGALSTRLGGKLTAANLLHEGARLTFTTQCQAGAPISHAIPSPAAASEPNTNLPKSGAKPVIHLIEDEADMRHLMLLGLQNAYQIVQHTDAESFLMRLQQEKQKFKADLLIIDLLLPGADGLSLIRTIRQMPALKNIPIVAMAGSNFVNHREQAFNDGADDYFTKPFNLQELSIRIHNLLQRRAQILKGTFVDTVASHTHIPAKPLASPIQAILLSVPEDKKEWVSQLISVIQKHMSNQDLDIALLAREMAVSERQLYRFAKSATTYSPNQLIHEVRLYSALNLLMTKHELPVAQVSLEVGFENPGYFSVVFKKRFGKNPSEIKNEPANS